MGDQGPTTPTSHFQASPSASTRTRTSARTTTRPQRLGILYEDVTVPLKDFTGSIKSYKYHCEHGLFCHRDADYRFPPNIDYCHHGNPLTRDCTDKQCLCMMDKDWGREVDRPIPLPGAENITDGRQPVRRVRGAIGGQGENLDNLDNLIPQYDQITLQQGNLVENYNLGLDLAIGHQSGRAEPACLIGAAEAAGQIIAADTENQISTNEADVTRAAGSTATSTTDATTAISATSTSTSITAAELTTDTAGKERSGGPGEGKQSISRAGHAAQGAGTPVRGLALGSLEPLVLGTPLVQLVLRTQSHRTTDNLSQTALIATNQIQNLQLPSTHP